MTPVMLKVKPMSPISNTSNRERMTQMYAHKSLEDAHIPRSLVYANTQLLQQTTVKLDICLLFWGQHNKQ